MAQPSTGQIEKCQEAAKLAHGTSTGADIGAFNRANTAIVLADEAAERLLEFAGFTPELAGKALSTGVGVVRVPDTVIRWRCF